MSKLDPKNIGLVRLVYRLRQDIDVYRIIGLNVSSLEAHGASSTFWAHIQLLAHESIALTICKILERERNHDLNSIPGIIAVLPKVLTPAQCRDVDAFSRRFGCTEAWSDVRTHLGATLDHFTAVHRSSLGTLRTFRNKFAAHTEHAAVLESLPSIDEFEAVFEFADSFYRLISGGILDIGPTLIGPDVGAGLIRVMKRLGIKEPKIDFEPAGA